MLEVCGHLAALKLLDDTSSGEADVGRALDDNHVITAQPVADRGSSECGIANDRNVWYAGLLQLIEGVLGLGDIAVH